MGKFDSEFYVAVNRYGDNAFKSDFAVYDSRVIFGFVYGEFNAFCAFAIYGGNIEFACGGGNRSVFAYGSRKVNGRISSPFAGYMLMSASAGCGYDTVVFDSFAEFMSRNDRSDLIRGEIIFAFRRGGFYVISLARFEFEILAESVYGIEINVIDRVA